MNPIKKLSDKFRSTDFGYRYLNDSRFRVVFSAIMSFCVNIIYALYNGWLSVSLRSWWFAAFGIYYMLLSIMRFIAVTHERRSKGKTEFYVMKTSGILLVVLSFVLASTVYMAANSDNAQKHHEIIMITIATYTFTKLTLAIINAVKAGKTNSPLLITIRNISCADAAASILLLQRSMFASFSGTPGTDIFVMNICTGTAVFLFVLILGTSMIRAQSKNEVKKKWQK